MNTKRYTTTIIVYSKQNLVGVINFAFNIFSDKRALHFTTLYIRISEVLTRQFSKKIFRKSSEESTQEQTRALPTPPVTSVNQSPGSPATTFRTMDDGYLVPNEPVPHVYQVPQSQGRS